MTSGPHGPYRLGYTCATMVMTKSSKGATWSKSQKNHLSSDCPLQLEGMKLESLVIADQNAAVNTFPGLVHTARQATEVGFFLSRCANQQWRQPVTKRSMTGVKS